MIICRLILKNWRNFREVDVALRERAFIVGPNASGKSNFLDVFRFLRDVTKTGGGLQEAVGIRGGVSKMRCLSARTRSDIEIEVHLSEEHASQTSWRYALGFTQTGGGVFRTRAKIKYEKVWDFEKNLICDRPNNNDKKDEKLLEYTFLEQPNANARFREIASFLQDIQYLHVLPQLVRDPQSFIKASNEDDYFGRGLIERINRTNVNTRKAYLRRIEAALQHAVPQFHELQLVKDEMGIPHLQATYQHWRPSGAKQREDQFSDGTLRLIGFLWSLLDGTKPLLLEEPEQSLHTGIVSNLAEIIAKLQRKKSGVRQIILSTHSYELLANRGIAGEELLLLIPGDEGTEVSLASARREVKALLDSGMSIGDIVIPKTLPQNANQMVFEF